MRVLIFGASGTIGAEIYSQLIGYNIIKVGRDLIDFSENYIEDKIEYFLNLHNPDIIINATGVFGNNDEGEFSNIFNVNVKSNWDIINYYRKNPSKKIIKIIMIGSSSYNGPRKNYALYAASKAALYSLYQSACEIFHDTKTIIGLVNLTRVYTNMIKQIDGVTESNCMSAEKAASHLIDFFLQLKQSNYINIK